MLFGAAFYAETEKYREANPKVWFILGGLFPIPAAIAWYAWYKRKYTEIKEDGTAAMVQCEYCGTKNPDNHNYCKHCGSPLNR